MNHLKIRSGHADNVPVNVDLFSDGGPGVPRPAWQVIDAARHQYLTGELTLPTTPPTNVYLRDGHVYFAERTTDGGLGVRLLVEGVITRAQLQKGSLLVSGAEHLGRLFDRDTTIEREPVELCVELMTDDVLVQVADDVVTDYRLTLYRRHPSGIDRWLPRTVEVISRLVERAEHADPDDEVLPARASTMPPRPARPVVPPPALAVPPVSMAPTPVAATPVAPAPAATDVIALAPASPAPDTPAPGPALNEPPKPMFDPIPPMATPALAPMPLTSPAHLLESHAPLTPAALLESPTVDDDSGISLAHSAVEAIMSTAIAEEVAEAVRRALAAIDGVAAPPTAVSPADVMGAGLNPAGVPSAGI